MQKDETQDSIKVRNRCNLHRMLATSSMSTNEQIMAEELNVKEVR